MSNEDWPDRALGDLALFEYGAALPAPSRVGDDFPVFGSNGEVGRHRSPLVKGPGIIVGRKGTVGALTWSEDDFWPIDTTYYVEARPGVDKRWLYWAMSTLGLNQLDSSTGVPGLNRNDAYRLRLTFPPRDKQQRIADVLDAVDDQIRLTESVTSKLRATFVGLLCRLLIQGTQSDAASSGNAVLEFGERSIRLPKHWTMEPIGQLLGSVDPAMRSGPFGSALLKHELVESGVPLLGIDNVHIDKFVSDFRRFVTPSKAVELSRYRVRPADVMITIMGTVGRSCLVPVDIGLALSSKHVWTLTFDDARYRPYLASLQLNHAPWARAHLRQDEQGGIMGAIRSDTLKTLMLPTPPIDEQLEIEAILKTLESKIANQGQSLTKLRTLKTGLAEDLLTGRVRVRKEVVS